jgi:hypothetical protein
MITYIIVAKIFLSDFAPSFAKQAHASPAVTESTSRLLDSISPGDFIKLKLLGPPTIQFSGRLNSADTDTSFWQPPSLAGKEWDFLTDQPLLHMWSTMWSSIMERKG